MTGERGVDEIPVLVEMSKLVFYESQADSIRASRVGMRSIGANSDPKLLPEWQHGYPEDFRSVLRHRGGGNCRLLPALSVVEPGPVSLVARAGSVQLVSLCLAPYSPPWRSWSRLRGIWWSLCRGCDDVALGGRRYPADHYRLGWRRSRALGNGHHHVRPACNMMPRVGNAPSPT